jgi:hypothetical protein
MSLNTIIPSEIANWPVISSMSNAGNAARMPPGMRMSSPIGIVPSASISEMRDERMSRCP